MTRIITPWRLRRLYKVWMARQYPAYYPNTLLLDNALATMGAGVPSAMAAKIVHPEVLRHPCMAESSHMLSTQVLPNADGLTRSGAAQVPVVAVVGDGGCAPTSDLCANIVELDHMG